MKITTLRLRNFQSFGAEPTSITFEDLTFFIGPNGCGKTAILQALCRLFSIDPKFQRIIKSDFHVSTIEENSDDSEKETLWIEIDFEFPELNEDDGDFFTIPSNFTHMRLKTENGVPIIRFRLTAELDLDGEIEEKFNYVLEVDENGEPTKEVRVTKSDRKGIQVHYLPARRDPLDHISYGTNTLIGRILRAVQWLDTQESITSLTEEISTKVSTNPALRGFGEALTKSWKSLHTGKFYENPEITFSNNDIDSILRHLSITFSPCHFEDQLDYTRLSDGQKSLLYLSLVFAAHEIGLKVLGKEIESFNIDKLRPAIFTFIAMEEPENSLSPHYLGRIIKSLNDFSKTFYSQSAITTHSPALLKRIDPQNIRHLRLNNYRLSQVKLIKLPANTDEARKFVREAVRAYPEIYFSRLVILGEGASEELVIPRMLEAHGLEIDLSSISIAPLGGRHVNHFWRLLEDLNIPYITLLDLDLGRHQGGWGRIRYSANQLLKFSPEKSKLTEDHINGIPNWNASSRLLESTDGPKWIKFLESNGVFFSSPLDLDFMMLKAFKDAYQVNDTELVLPTEKTIVNVLGQKFFDAEQYDQDSQKYFSSYNKLFKNGSKPTEHILALSKLSNLDLEKNAPDEIKRLIDAVNEILKELEE